VDRHVLMEESYMLERLRRRQQQKGFTLIELLVVVIIIGLLAAIAIPAFLGQRDKANDAAAKSLVRNAATAVEAAYADTQDYSTIKVADLQAIEPNIDWNAAGLAKSDQVAFTAAATGYVLVSESQSKVKFTLTKDTSKTPSVTRTTSTGKTW
jgi:type IV pilus assembly protein PilA